MFYIYIIKSKWDNKLYLNDTNNLKRKLTEHKNKESELTKSSAILN